MSYIANEPEYEKDKSKRQKIARSTGTITFALIIGKLFGFGRESVFAAIYGVGREMDAYVAARTFPDLLFNLVLTGVIGFALVPAFISSRLEGNEEEAWALSSAVLKILLIISTIVIIIGLIGAGIIVNGLAPGLDEATIRLAIQMTRMLLPSLIIVTVTGVTKGLLNALGHFAAPAWGNAILNVSIVLAVILLSPHIGILSAIIGILIGAMLRLIPQLVILFRLGGHYQPGISLINPKVKNILFGLGPILTIQFLLYGRFIVERMIASTLAEGSLAILNYAYRLVELLVSLGGGAIGIAAFPILTEYAAKKDNLNLWRTSSFNIKMLALIIIPASIIFFVFSQPIVVLVYQRGAFTPEVAKVTSDVLAWYSIGLFGASVVSVLLPTFYAINKTYIPLTTTFISIGITAIIGWAMSRFVGVMGIAIGSSVGWIINMFLLGYMLYRSLDIDKLPYVDMNNLRAILVRSFLAAIIMGWSTWFIYVKISLLFSIDNLLIQIISLFVTFIIGVLIYFVILYLFRVKEIGDALRLLLQKV